jgi:hypothetical protein
MHFKKHRPRDNRESGADRGIEPLQVSNLADAAESLCQADKFVSFRKRRRQRLFDQHIDTGLHQLLSRIAVMAGGHGDRSGLDFAMRCNELLDRPKTAAAKLARNRRSPRSIHIYDSDQSDWNAFAGKLMVDARVVAAECAGTNHGDVDGVVGGQCSVRRRQVAGRPVDLITKNCQT